MRQAHGVPRAVSAKPLPRPGRNGSAAPRVRHGLHCGAEKGSRHVASLENRIHHSVDGRCRHSDDRISRQCRAIDAQNRRPSFTSALPDWPT